jgi:hypothetical protein
MKPVSNDIRTEQIRAALLAIAEANNGLLNPAHVVERASDPDSVLHAEFIWDDDTAAQAYRVAQAGALIRRVKLTLIRENPTTREIAVQTTRQFQSRESQRTESAGYETVESIMSDPVKRMELIDQVLRELAAYRRRYAGLMALGDVWGAIDDAMETLDVREPKRPQQPGEAAQA